MRYLDSDARAELIRSAIAKFPATFGLRAFPGQRFRLSESSSYVNDNGEVMLYCERQVVDRWLLFAKDSVIGFELEVERWIEG